jgi:hypothetical protein
MATLRDRFRRAVILDSEYRGGDRGERHDVTALVAHVLDEGQPVREWRWFEDELRDLKHNPLPRGPDTLWITFVGQAEWRSLRSLGWAWPACSVDLYAEARCLRNLALPRSLRVKLGLAGDGLVDHCRHYGVEAIDPALKQATRDLILRGGPWTGEERREILDYCNMDVTMTSGLWDRLEPLIPPTPALFRGWFVEAIADQEDRGIPIDTKALQTLVTKLDMLRRQIVARLDEHGLCNDGSVLINPTRFAAFVERLGIRWPLTPTGKPVMRLKVLRERLARYPDLAPIVALAQALNDLRGLRNLPVGADGRARASLWPFASLTGRNQPRGREFIFSLSRWTRGLIRPEPGCFLVYIDWEGQEYAVIAYLSQDPLLIRCYEADNDPYCNIGIVMGLLPPNSRKEHPDRDVIKTVILGLFYGRGIKSIAAATRRTKRYISDVVQEFRRRCPKALRWLESHIDALFLLDRIETRHGWVVHRHPLTKSTTAGNFPVQAAGANMMQWAACLAYENGVPLIGSVHDSFLAEGRLEDEDRIVETLVRCMRRASEIVLDGAVIRAKPIVFRYPNRFIDDKGWSTWSWIMSVLDPSLAIRPAQIA